MKSESRITWERGKGLADSRLQDIERHIKSGHGLNWIPDELSTAIHWAMQGYLIQKGINPDTVNGWNSMRIQFSKCSSKSLASEGSYLLSAANRLEYDMFEIEIDEWISQASNLLSREKEFIKSMQDELLSGDDEKP